MQILSCLHVRSLISLILFIMPLFPRLVTNESAWNTTCSLSTLDQSAQTKQACPRLSMSARSCLLVNLVDSESEKERRNYIHVWLNKSQANDKYNGKALNSVSLNYFKNKNMWLSKLTRIHIKSEYKKSYNKIISEQKRDRFKTFFSDSSSHWFIFLITGLIVSLSWSIILLKDVNFLFVINLDRESATLIADQRITNTAAIVGVSFVVIGLMINNLKEKTKSNYDLLFKGTFLYPLTYFIFSIIIYLILLSTLRNTLNELVYINAIENLTILIIIAIVCIVILFTKIIKIFEPNFFNELSLREYLKAAKDTLLRERIISKSKEVYVKQMHIKGGLQLDDKIDKSLLLEINIKNENRAYIKDINVNTITKQLRKERNKEFYFLEMALGDYLWSDRAAFYLKKVKHLEATSRKINSAFSLTDNPLTTTYFSMRASLNERLTEAITNKDEKTVKQLVRHFEETFELYYQITGND